MITSSVLDFVKMNLFFKFFKRVLIKHVLTNSSFTVTLVPTVAQGQEVDVPKEKNKEEEEYGNLWVKYWNMDPENFIWGIDPNEVPPEVSWN